MARYLALKVHLTYTVETHVILLAAHGAVHLEGSSCVS